MRQGLYWVASGSMAHVRCMSQGPSWGALNNLAHVADMSQGLFWGASNTDVARVADTSPGPYREASLNVALICFSRLFHFSRVLLLPWGRQSHVTSHPACNSNQIVRHMSASSAGMTLTPRCLLGVSWAPLLPNAIVKAPAVFFSPLSSLFSPLSSLFSFLPVAISVVSGFHSLRKHFSMFRAWAGFQDCARMVVSRQWLFGGFGVSRRQPCQGQILPEPRAEKPIIQKIVF